MVSVLFALLTALFNGLASVLQRIAAAAAPQSRALHLSLFGYLIRRKVWLAGIGMVILAALCQATALAWIPCRKDSTDPIIHCVSYVLILKIIQP